jgi:hypothetical protein
MRSENPYSLKKNEIAATGFSGAYFYILETVHAG